MSISNFNGFPQGLLLSFDLGIGKTLLIKFVK